MKVLHRTLRRQWFDMIRSGEKKEEYLEFKWYWICCLLEPTRHMDYEDWYPQEIAREIQRFQSDTYPQADIMKAFETKFKHFDIIRFTNGYAKNAPTFDIESKGIRIGVGNPEWGAPTEQVFILSLGKIITP